MGPIVTQRGQGDTPPHSESQPSSLPHCHEAGRPGWSLNKTGAILLPHRAGVGMVLSRMVRKAPRFQKLSDRFPSENVTPTWPFEG